MARADSTTWRKASISPLDIVLDRENPRINVESSDKESDIMRKLILYEEVQDLARKISQNGLLPGERIIVVQERGQWIVLEGNRRMCACKLLLSPNLVPTEFRKTFPKLATATEIARIQKVEADVAPDRRAAEPVLTLRHTESGVRKWKPVARMRRVRRLLDEGFTVDQIAKEYNASPTNIRKTIKEYRLLQLAEGLKGLSVAEQQKLNNPDLKTNPYTRFFDLSNVKEYLRLSFSPNGDVVIEPPRRAFDAKLKLIVRAFLNNDDFDTRTDPEDILGSDFKKFKASPPRTPSKPPAPTPPPRGPAPAPPSSPTPTPSGGGGQSIRPDRFFENLTCRVSDNAIAAVVTEIKKINADQYPISATYLLRVLIELCLRRLIANSGRSVSGKMDPSLTDLVNFSLNNPDVFPSPRMRDVIAAAKAQKCFEYLNIVNHQKWMNADPTTVRSVANQLRNFIQHVVQGEP
jgi:transposase-like protein